MAKKLLFLSIVLIGLFLAIPTTRAAFPVKGSNTESTQSTANPSVQSVEASKVSTQQETVKKAKAEKKKQTLLEKMRRAGGKSQVIALILAILVGGIGIHRFYLGYTWQGIVQLLTLGGCGIWSLIDLIRIITGDLTPKDGDYDKTL